MLKPDTTTQELVVMAVGEWYAQTPTSMYDVDLSVVGGTTEDSARYNRRRSELEHMQTDHHSSEYSDNMLRCIGRSACSGSLDSIKFITVLLPACSQKYPLSILLYFSKLHRTLHADLQRTASYMLSAASCCLPKCIQPYRYGANALTTREG